MKTRFVTSATPVAGRFRYSMLWFAIPLGMVVIGIVLASTLYRTQPLALVSAPVTADARAALDQHERHPEMLVSKAEHDKLDQHERHPEMLIPKHDTAWPRRHAVWETATDADIYAPLDQHERHPEMLISKAENAAIPDTLDRYLAAREH